MKSDVKSYINDLWKPFENTNSPLYGKFIHTENVCNIAKKIDSELDDIEYYARIHDIGRIVQYDLLQRYDDNVVTHHSLGLSAFEKFIIKNDIPIDDEMYRLRLIIAYHGRLNLINQSIHSDLDLRYLNCVTIADELENGCYGALSYLEKELKNDSKSYIRNNPDRNQKECKNELLKYMENGIWFDKFKYCETYAEYFVFACTIAIKAVNKYPNVAIPILNSPCYGFASAIDGYIYLFNTYLDSPEKEEVIKIISRYKD